MKTAKKGEKLVKQTSLTKRNISLQSILLKSFWTTKILAKQLKSKKKMRTTSRAILKCIVIDIRNHSIVNEL